ncbi:hypothetical protein [Silvibacterium dinghuense]|uniref:Uncharacterized protein n=1 Tax=Silvibacterium dinghuense TaxID=1560006 RepID=A0A4Q1SIP1_9BACT|nr:hypothetical protein [Silvibacterium dinghuense]RXS97273.1 hypothetical protein ESZ00_05005 [Silvibacterium dinghuense]GGG97699.1 hypothetical protein GCM10011586_11200 [Silvibacterium dinghuense]
MIPEQHALRQLFHQVVSGCYSEHLGIHDLEVTSYVADLLTEFCAADKLYPIHDAEGHPIRDVNGMLAASDPVHGTADSFDAERRVRKHIGDFALFSTGMFPEAAQRARFTGDAGLLDMVRIGKESYSIVSQFNLFEYQNEAAFFGRLAEDFETYMYGLTKVRGELDRLGAPVHLM